VDRNGAMNHCMTNRIELDWWQQDYTTILGVDEVGRGALAGPVVVGGVMIERGESLVEGVTDSKLLSAARRLELAGALWNQHRRVAVAEASMTEIDSWGIMTAIHTAIYRLIQQFTEVEVMILDGGFTRTFLDSFPFKAQSYVKGDQYSYAIGAASIVAKVYRDALMIRLAELYPSYGLARHKGYGTFDHREIIKQDGLSAVHRKSFCSRII